MCCARRCWSARRAGRAVARGRRRERARRGAVAAALPWRAGPCAAPRRMDARPRARRSASRCVQGAIPQDLKWLGANREATLDAVSRPDARHWGAADRLAGGRAAAFSRNEVGRLPRRSWPTAGAQGSALVLGLLRDDRERPGGYYNSHAGAARPTRLVLQAPSRAVRRVLPVPAFVRDWMRLMSLPYSDFTPGPKSRRRCAGRASCSRRRSATRTPRREQLRRAARRATLLVNVTNDAWFGGSTRAHQHLQIARLRALEAGRFLLRATRRRFRP